MQRIESSADLEKLRLSLYRSTVALPHPQIEVLRLGLRPFEEVWALQKERHRALIDGKGGEALILCRHPHTITFGKSSKRENILVQPDELKRKGVLLFEIERGGDVTYHGPNQLVIYPIIDLTHRRRDVGWYMRQLEQIIIDALERFELVGTRVQGKTGVWIQLPETVRNKGPEMNEAGRAECAIEARQPFRKIASIGVRISRWCTLHGIGLNVGDCAFGFSLINPCGFKDIVMTNIAAEMQGRIPPTMEQVEELVIRQCLTHLAVEDPSNTILE